MKEVELFPEKVLSSPDIEMSVIGSIFVNSQSAYFALNQLSLDDFSEGVYKTIFEEVSDYYGENYEVDRNLIEAKLKQTRNGESSTVINAIHKSINFCNPKNIEKYCQELQSLTFRRSLYKSAQKLQQSALDLSVEESQLYKEIDKTKEVEYRTNPDIAKTSTQIKEESKDEIPQLITGLKEWDDWFYEKGGRGLGTTELIFARPGHGKTYYLFRKITALAKQGYKWLHFHLEDTDLEASTRIDAGVSPELPENDNVLVISNHRYIHDILKDIRYYKHKYDIQGVSVDHLGRVNVRGFTARDKVPAMIEISNSLTDTCSDLKLHGAFTVQPNKSYKGRQGWDNALREEDLKGATEIFEDAFVVTTLLRPNIYPELRKGVADQAYVLGPKNGEANYDSVFMTQIKNRRQQIGNEHLQMIQHGNVLLMEREHWALNNPDAKQEPKVDITDDIPF